MDFHYYCYTCMNPLQEQVKFTCSAKGNKIATKSSTSEALLDLPGALQGNPVSAGQGSIFLTKVMLLNPYSLCIMTTTSLENLSTKIATKPTL